MSRTSRPDLAPFEELNAREKAEGKKIPWGERYDLIRAHFPAAVKMDWRKAFQSTDDPIYAKIIRDVLERDQKELNGQKSTFDPEAAKARLRQLSGDDYTQLPFREAFGVLAGDRSIRHLQRKLGLSKNMVWRLKLGTMEPDLYILETVARAFNKHPSYFVEYRIAAIMGALGEQMEMAPEITVDLYRRIHRKKVK